MNMERETEQTVIDQIRKWEREAKKQPYLIAVDGMCASGKTTLSTHVREACPDIGVVHMDDFFLRPDMRTQKRLAEPGGNVDYERFRAEVLEPLEKTGSCCYRVYSCKSQSFVRTEKLNRPGVVLIEGAYSAHPFFGDVYDAVYFLSVSPEEQVRRIRNRNGEQMLNRFLNEWIPMENRYFETFGIREKCHVKY